MSDIIFPSLGYRFVSVLDCLDSEGDNTDMLHFRSLMNDYHLRDLSNKIKSVLHSKKVSGQYISAYTPYGYCKSTEDRHKLVIDEYAAGIVRRIFEMRLAESGYSKIAAILNSENILPPRRYWRQVHSKSPGNSAQLWTDTMVKIILHNEVYIGNLLQNRVGTRSYKDPAQISKPESIWIRHEAAHEAIISTETWQAVQEINQNAKQHSVGNQIPTPKLFSAMLVCSDCKSPMVASTQNQRRKNGDVKRYVSYSCSRYLRSGRCVCSRHRVSELTLAQIISTEIRAQAQTVTLDKNAIVDKLKRQLTGVDEQRLSGVKQEISRLRRQTHELETLTAKLYEDKYSGAISQDTFIVLMQKNEQERLAKVEHLEALLAEVDIAEKKTSAIHDWAALIQKYLNLQELDRATLDELIDHIEIGEHTVVDGQRHQDIKVFYRFVGLIE